MPGIPAGWPGHLSWRRDLRSCTPPARMWGRDPTTLDVTVGQIVAIPQTTQDDGESDSPGGSPSPARRTWPTMATIRGARVAHLIVWPQPFETNVCNS